MLKTTVLASNWLRSTVADYPTLRLLTILHFFTGATTQMVLNFTQLSPTFPPTPEREISRDNLISLIADMFSSERKSIVVQGAAGSGKTALLGQFAKAFSDRSFSFFVGTTLLTSSPRYFLLDMCEQMGLALNRKTESLEQLDTEELKQIYYDFVRRVALITRKTGQPYYFVVDGLELIDSDDEEKSLMGLLPAEPLDGLYLLFSSEPNRVFSFPHHKLDIIGFSLTETERYLADLALTPEDIQLVHKRSGGLPAYPSAIRRLLNSGMSFSELSSSLPSEITGLFDLEWDRLKFHDDRAVTVLALLAYARETLQTGMLTEITAIDDHDLRKTIANIPFLALDPGSQSVIFISEAHKQYTSERLIELKEQIETALVQYYSRNPYSPSSLVLLPSYLAIADQYEQLKTLMSNEYMSQALSAGRDISVLRRTIRLAAGQAVKREDWISLPRFALSSSLLRTIARNPVGEDELEALLALGDYTNAFDIAYRALLPADRLQLLALVCSHRQQAGLQVPENILAELQQMAETLEVGSLHDRGLDIAAGLFDLMPETAIKLVERSQGISAGEKSLDLARAMLALRLQTEATEMVRARIANPVLRDFARAHSPKTSKMSADEVILESDKIKHTSGKLFLLTSWCNGNRSNSSAKIVIAKAVEVITSDSSYAPSVRLLRQLTEPLVNITIEDSDKLLERLAILKSTSITEPIEEGLRFDLLMATLHSRRSRDLGINSLLEIYFALDSIEELDTRCYCIARILTSLPIIDPSDTQELRTELIRQLEADFASLLNSSADQFASARRMLRELAKYDPKRAIEFAERLNTSSRRDKALRAVLWVHCGQPVDRVDFSLVEQLLAKITEDERRELSLVLAIQRLAESGALTSPAAKGLLIRTKDIADQQNKCYACAFALNAMSAASNTAAAYDVYANLTDALSKVESQWERIRLGFKLTAIIAKGNLNLARELFDQTIRQKTDSFLSDQFFSQVYINCLRLALRAFSGLAAYDSGYAVAKDQLIDLIQLIPSVNNQCTLLADLALRHVLARKREDFELIVKEHLLPVFHNCQTLEDQTETLMKISACLYEYDPSWTLEQIAKISPSRADTALMSIVTYLVTHSLPDDPVEMDALRVDIDAKTARTISGVIGCIKGDSEIYVAIEMLVDGLVKPDPRDNSREMSKKLIEREALDIASRLEEIVRTKLPDPQGIQHEGYVVAATSLIIRLRAAAERRSRLAHAAWSDLARRARAIPNVADRVVVLAWTGQHMFWTDQNLAFILIREAEALVPSITNVLDKADRFYQVAKAWKEVDRKDGARMLLQTAMTVLKAHSWDRSRNEVSEHILKLAHSIDPEFASSLTPLMEDPFQEHEARTNLSSFDLHKNPNRVQTLARKNDPDELRNLLGQAAWKLIGSLNSGMSQARHPREIAQWLSASVDGKFEDVFPVLAWSIQNNLLQTKQPAVLTAAYQAVYESVQLCKELSQLLLGIRQQTSTAMTLTLPDDLLLFRAGKRSEALLTVQDWISNNGRDYLKIYDPYFSVTDIGILKHVQQDVQVFIITSWKAQKGISPGDRSIEIAYRKAWEGVSHHEPPWTQIIITGIKSSGDSPLHSRYLVSKQVGIYLGTSIGGLGEKHTDLRMLSEPEAAKVEVDLIDVELVPHLRMFKGERLIVYPFLL